MLERTRRYAPILVIGAVSLLWQVAAARAVMAGLYGNELTLGLVLGSWLVLMGLSTAAVTHIGACRRSPRALLAVALALLPVALLASVLLQTLTLPAFSAVGEITGMGRALWAALVCLLPPCVLLGAGFGLVSLDVPAAVPAARWAARIYAIESLGTALAGVAFHLWLWRLPLPLVAITAGALAWMVAALRAPGLIGGWRWAHGAMLVAGLGALIALLPAVQLPGVEPNVPGYERVIRRSSRHAELAVLRRGDQRLFTASGVVAFTNQDHQQAEADVHLALLAHPAPERVLMIGGGLGGGLTQVLRHPVEHVDYVELDPDLVALARRYSTRELRQALADPRLQLQIGDGRQLARRTREHYDAILVGLPDPSSALVNRFYTEEFFESARRALRPGGLLRVVLSGSETYLGDAAARVHATVRAALKRAFGNVAALPGGRSQLLTGRDSPIGLRFSELAPRFRRRGLLSDTFGEPELMARTLPFARERYRERLSEIEPRRNTDLHPAAYFDASLLGLAPRSPAVARALERAAALGARHAWALVVGAFALALLAAALRRRRPPAALAIALVGLTGLVVELALLLATQEILGVVYHQIGALITAFMVGLALGAPLGARLVTRWPLRALALALAGCAAAALSALGVLHLVQRHPDSTALLLWADMLLVGLSVGAAFPPAAAQLAARHGTGPGAARAYAWDLGGAAIGALLASGFILPVLGLQATCLLGAALCGGCGLGLALRR